MHIGPHLHHLERESFDQLMSGGGDPAAVEGLRAGERSWRLLLLRALLDAAADIPTGPLPPLDEGWQLLSRACATAPEPVERLLLYPAVGTWAAHALRRVRGSAQGPSPLWVETGHLHAVAATAAILAGMEFRAVIPVREGWAVLPALGAVKVPSEPGWGTAEVRSGGGSVRVADTEVGGPGWHALSRLRADGCTLVLDDLDPYRALRGPTSPDPLGDTGRWQELFAGAWSILGRRDSEAAQAMAAGLVSVVPRPRSEMFRPHSASSGDAFGAAVASEPDDAEQFASTLVHEFQHNKLGAFMHLFTLYRDGGTALHYAPWRDDPRPPCSRPRSGSRGGPGRALPWTGRGSACRASAPPRAVRGRPCRWRGWWPRRGSAGASRPVSW